MASNNHFSQACVNFLEQVISPGRRHDSKANFLNGRQRACNTTENAVTIIKNLVYGMCPVVLTYSVHNSFVSFLCQVKCNHQVNKKHAIGVRIEKPKVVVTYARFKNRLIPARLAK